MTLAQAIQDAIERAKQHPAGKDRNKTISKLEDALVWAERLERNTSDAPAIDKRVTGSEGVFTAIPSLEKCICKIGMFNSNCPIHGREV